MRFVFVFVIYFFIYVQLWRVVDVFICWSIIVCIIIVSITVVFMLSLLVSLLYYIVSIATAISIIITSIVIDGIESRCTQFLLIEDETTVSKSSCVSSPDLRMKPRGNSKALPRLRLTNFVYGVFFYHCINALESVLSFVFRVDVTALLDLETGVLERRRR